MSNQFHGQDALPGTCHCCGNPVGDLLLSAQVAIFSEAAPALPGAKNKCIQCGKMVCEKCFSRYRSKCVRCTTNRDSWCKVPGIS